MLTLLRFLSISCYCIYLYIDEQEFEMFWPITIIINLCFPFYSKLVNSSIFILL